MAMAQIGQSNQKLKGLIFTGQLAETARLRLENPEMSIAAVGELCDHASEKGIRY